MADRYRDAGVEVFATKLVPPRRALELRKQTGFFFSYWPSVWRIARILRAWRADVVHVNTLNNLQGPIAARLAGKPLVWHVRELGKGGFIDRAMLSMVRLLAARAVAISSAVAQTLSGCGDRVRLVLNAVNLSEYETPPDPSGVREELNIPAKAPLVLVVSRIEPWKGQHVAVNAMPRILEAVPEARLAIVGGPAVNKPEYLAALKARCEQPDLAQRVLFTGIRTDIPRLLAAADVLTQPTATAEPFGRTIVEGMAAGIPVVATAAGGPLDIVDDGKTGLLAPPGEAAPLADAVIRLLSDKDLARQIASNARAAAFERFSLDRVVRQMEAVLLEAASPRA
jgi:glycosyltransferase involved in cell wall biosynthesis